MYKYVDILKSMIINDPESRINSFSEIQRKMINVNENTLDFDENDKKIYVSIASYFENICIAIDDNARYKDDLTAIKQGLQKIMPATLLEPFLNNNRLFMSCFINGDFICTQDTLIPMSELRSFIEWWLALSDYRKLIVLNNLWNRFDKIYRTEIWDLPY